MSKHTSKKQQLAQLKEKPSQLDAKGDVICISQSQFLRNHRSEGGLRNIQRPEVQQRIQEQQVHQLRKKMQEKAKRIEKEIKEIDKQYAQCLQGQRLANDCYFKAHDKYFQDLKGNHPDKQISQQQMSRLNVIWQQECEKMSFCSNRRDELRQLLSETESIIAPSFEYQRPKTQSELARDKQIQEAEHELQRMLIASLQAEREYYQFERKYLGTNDKDQFNKMSSTYEEKQRHYYKLQEAIHSITLRISKLHLNDL